MHPLLKLALDLGPLLIFFAANALFGIFTATAVFMAAMLIVIAIGIVVERKLSPMPLITGALVLVFGGLTLWLSNDIFIKIKPTILYAMFAGILLDALTVQVIDGRVEISLGWSILLYAVLAGIMHGLRPLFIRGRWEVHCIMTGICTSLIVLAQYLMITFRRGSLLFSEQVWWQIGGPGLVAMLMAPIIFLFLQWLGHATAFPYLPGKERLE